MTEVICFICNLPIEVSNPLILNGGTVHRTCWIKDTNKKLGIE